MTKLYRDRELLEYLYHDRGMSQREIADRLGCGKSTIDMWMDRLGVESRSKSEALRVNYAGYSLDYRGYAYWQSARDDRDRPDQVKVHRLLAVAEHGFDAVCDNHVHHENRLRWDNRPANIDVVSPSEHSKIHSEDRLRGRGVV